MWDMIRWSWNLTSYMEQRVDRHIFNCCWRDSVNCKAIVNLCHCAVWLRKDCWCFSKLQRNHNIVLWTFMCVSMVKWNAGSGSQVWSEWCEGLLKILYGHVLGRKFSCSRPTFIVCLRLILFLLCVLCMCVFVRCTLCVYSIKRSLQIFKELHCPFRWSFVFITYCKLSCVQKVHNNSCSSFDSLNT